MVWPGGETHGVRDLARWGGEGGHRWLDGLLISVIGPDRPGG